MRLIIISDNIVKGKGLSTYDTVLQDTVEQAQHRTQLIPAVLHILLVKPKDTGGNQPSCRFLSGILKNLLLLYLQIDRTLTVRRL